ncbi:MAG: SpoIID/LytB domain-containing protein, partial [Elusimicrobia bacterium]|nr:SpoIID/LytB domain-containing protein [Elusimicrobiota bacterium]
MHHAGSALCLLFSFLVPTFAGEPNDLIRIGILPKVYQTVLKPVGKFAAADLKTGKKESLLSDEKYIAETTGSQGIRLGPYSFSNQVRLVPLESHSTLRIDQKNYRGSFLITAHPGGTFTLVEELGIEEYLTGVLPLEMSPNWPLEALKAQAVVSRTFALNNLGRNKKSGFDLSADTKSQMYGGSDQENAQILEAVESTKGEVLTYKGETFNTYFHSCCAGHTSSETNIWGGKNGSHRSLRGVTDHYCRTSPQHFWKAYIPSNDILQALHKNGFWFTRLKGIRLLDRDRSGYVQTFKILSDQGPLEVRANDFRNWIGNSDLRSTYVTHITP